MNERPVLIAFDGSPGATYAIETAGELLAPRPATVLSVWTPLLTAAPAVGGIPVYLGDLEEDLAEGAAKTAEEGARIARDAGFEPTACTASDPSAWSAIVGMAERLDAAAIVVGARGLAPLKSMVLGSTSNGVVHHTKRPVLVICQPDSEGAA